MSFKDIFKSGYLENISAVGIPEMAVALLLALGLGLFIFLVYKKTYSGVMYSTSFGVTLIALTMISTLVILAVTSNVVLSLGMVGALSIVRFRTAIKDPMDLAFLFWSISIGIICGAGLAIIAVALSLILSLIVWIFNALPVAKAPMLLMVTVRNTDGEEAILSVINKYCKNATVKSRTFSSDQLDMVVEIRSKEEGKLAREIMNIESVTSVSVLAHDGEVTFA